jgi:hypothetical protein
MSKTIVILSAAMILLVPLGNLFSYSICGVDSIEALIYNNCRDGATIWIKVNNQPAVCQIVCLAANPIDPQGTCGVFPNWIGGKVYADRYSPYGFGFDPNTIEIARNTIEERQTTICGIADNPKAFDGGIWYIPFDLRGVR